MDKRLKYLIFFLSAGAFAALCVFLETNDTVRSDVSVEFMARSPYQLINVADLKKQVETSTADTHPDTISSRLFSVEKEIQTNPYVEKVLVYRQPSGEIQVQLWEHTPLYRVVSDSTDFYMSTDGSRMPLKKGTAVKVPLVRCSFHPLPHQEIKTVIDAMRGDDFFREIFLGLEVSRYAKGDGTGYTFSAVTRMDGIQIVLGGESYMEEKMENFKALYSYLSKENKLKEYKIVNLEFTDYLILQRKK